MHVCKVSSQISLCIEIMILRKYLVSKNPVLADIVVLDYPVRIAQDNLGQHFTHMQQTAQDNLG